MTRWVWLVPLATGLLVRPAAAQGPHGRLSPDVDCATCHSSTDWKVNLRTVSFDHNRAARFQLEGRHRDAACRSCHLALRFDEPQVENGECAACHADVHQGAFAQPCAQCHVTSAFSNVPAVAIHGRTSFPLTGAHAGLSCQACHLDDRAGAFAALDPLCVSCHQSDYAAAQPIDHQAAGFPTDCRQCHSTLAWTHGVRFDHAGVSGGFALVAAHARIRCASCHADGTLTSLFQPADQNDCLACHQPDYQRAHPGDVFPTTCLNCHGQDTWSGAQFDHAAVSGFALLGAHQRLACASCHVEGTMEPRWQPANQDDCVACHDDDYQREHGGSGFPTTCLACHTVETWDGATFANHDQVFPISRGPHADRDCQECHVQPGDFRAFSCFGCHSQSRTDGQHRGRSGYRYDSNACYSCHPNGRS
jgi:hypothetical protein